MSQLNGVLQICFHRNNSANDLASRKYPLGRFAQGHFRRVVATALSRREVASIERRRLQPHFNFALIARASFVRPSRICARDHAANPNVRAGFDVAFI